jgi:ribokinase
MRLAVIGHVEWVEFVRVDHVPAPGEIVHAEEVWSEAAGGGAVTAVQLAKLAGACDFYTAFGDDELGRACAAQLERQGVTLHVQWREEATRRAYTYLDARGERTITVLGDKLLPEGPLPVSADALFFVSGDPESLRSGREGALFAGATARELATIRAAAIELDLLVGSGEDDGERYKPGDVEPPPGLVVTTAGPLGGWAQPGGPFRAAPILGPVEDAYGCGDSFAAALTFALARGDGQDEALAFAAECGAAVLTGKGPYEGQVSNFGRKGESV